MTDVGILILRIVAGGTMFLSHGMAKAFSFSAKAAMFPDPLGLGSTVSMGMAVFAEFFCAILIVAGIATRLATIPLIGTMLVAFFVVHAADPFARKEMALLYLGMFIVIALVGPGRLSVDAILRAKKGGNAYRP